MMSRVIPQNPSEVMVLRKVTPNILTASTPFARVGLFKVGGRGTIVRLTSGALAVFSPTALTPEVQSAVNELGGNVRYITAPDIQHHIFLGPWHKAYPSAVVLGPEGLPEKRAKQKNENVPFTHVFTAKNKTDMKISEEFDADFEYEYVDGHVNKELVFNYKPDRTLIQADLIFNLPATEQYSRTDIDPSSGLMTKFFNFFQNIRGDAKWQKRLAWYVGSAGNRASYNASVKRINRWDFDRMIPCHGDVIETGGKDVFRKVMGWHLAA